MKTLTRATPTDRLSPLSWTPLALTLLLAGGAAHAAAAIERIGEPVERQLMARLGQVQQLPSSRLAPFTTDGCSGGLSVGWEHMAQLFPRLGEVVGDTPPWESCCVSHDRAYWQERAEHGYEARQAADETLRQCVSASAAQHGPVLAARLQVPVAAIEHAFATAADLMYAAVRVGGVPCSALPWRWGYGWPQCTPLGDSAPPRERK